MPRTEYAADWAFVPNKITLFRIALLEDFPDPAELEHEVWVTVIHELAHHLGIADDRLHDLGVDSGAELELPPTPTAGGTSSGAAPASNSPSRADLDVAAAEDHADSLAVVGSGSSPNSTAARAAAPAGSTSCFIRSSAKRMPARIVASSSRTIPSR